MLITSMAEGYRALIVCTVSKHYSAAGKVSNA